MNRVWQEIRAGWRDARWGFDVLVALLPLTLAIVLVADLVSGRVQLPPRVLTFGYGIMAGLLVRAFVARLWRGWKQRIRRDWNWLRTLARSGEAGHQMPFGVRGGEVRENSHSRRRVSH